ncbi:DNA primase [candidate division KSB1 bacterium]|nr:DNA primase [candidate division KSB1 bacterium]
MPGKVSEEKINQVRDANDIVDVISQYMTLNKKGKSYLGLCPFHSEKTPSFTVSPDKQLYYCFGCGKGGNIFTFLMEHEKLSFIESLQVLARKAGIPLEYDQENDARLKEKEAMYHAVRFAANFYYLNLVKSVQGKPARDYLLQRGVLMETIKAFGLGYSPDSWDGLIRAAAAKSIDVNFLFKTGLAIQRDKGGYYDRFRGRIMYPILDKAGRPIAFGARRLKEDNSAKYINSPEVTHFYEKRSVLYGLSQCRQSIQSEDAALMVEGYMDLISLYQAGIRNVVATSGTSLTAEHAQLLNRYTKNAILLYDGDSAGSRAALRGLDILLENDMDVRVAQLPKGEDPDSLIREKGKSVLTELLNRASPLVEFKVQALAQTSKLDTPEGKSKAIRAILESVLKIKDNIKQSVTIRELAERFFLDERLLLRELEQAKRQHTGPKAGPTISTQADGKNAPAIKPKTRTKADIAEIILTKLLIQSSDLESYIFKNLDIEKIRHSLLREIIQIIFLFHRENRRLDRAKLIAHFEDPKIASFITKALYEPVKYVDGTKLAYDCMVQLEKREITDAMKSIQLRLRECEKRGEDSSKLRQQWQLLRNELKKVEDTARETR